MSARLLLIIFAIAALFLIFPLFLPRAPTVKISVSLEPSTIKVDGESTLSITVENPARTDQKIKFLIETSPRVLILVGNEPLPKEDERYVYTFSLTAADRSITKVFNVKATLEAGTESAVYSILASVYADATEVGRDTKKLTVTS